MVLNPSYNRTEIDFDEIKGLWRISGDVGRKNLHCEKPLCMACLVI